MAKEIITAPKVEIVQEKIIKYKCDKCGVELSRDFDADSDFANDLQIYLNPEECVHSRVQLDLCSDCLEPVWQAICAAIGADPDAELRIGEDY